MWMGPPVHPRVVERVSVVTSTQCSIMLIHLFSLLPIAVAGIVLARYRS